MVSVIFDASTAAIILLSLIATIIKKALSASEIFYFNLLILARCSKWKSYNEQPSVGLWLVISWNNWYALRVLLNLVFSTYFHCAQVNLDHPILLSMELSYYVLAVPFNLLICASYCIISIQSTNSINCCVK